MHITIDERARLVHVSQEGMLLTLELSPTLTDIELETAAEGLRIALRNARGLVLNGEPVQLESSHGRRAHRPSQ